MWIIFALTAAIFDATKDTLSKKSSAVVSPYLNAFSLQFFSLIPAGLFVAYRGIPDIEPLFWVFSIASFFVGPIFMTLYFKALKVSEVSNVMPMLAFNPVFTTIIAIFVEDETPTRLSLVGIFIVVLGVYISKLPKKNPRILDPIKNIRQDIGAQYMLLNSLVIAIGVNIYKFRILYSSPEFATLIGTIFSVTSLFVIAKYQKAFSLKIIKEHIKTLSTIGLLQGAGNVLTGIAISTTFTPYVISVKRTSIVMSSIAAKFAFKEELGLMKLSGIVLTVLGVVTIVIG